MFKGRKRDNAFTPMEYVTIEEILWDMKNILR